MIPEKHLADLEDRFLRYVRIDSQSDEDSATLPSTAIQWDMLRLLADELRALGAADVEVTESGFTMATIPATPGYETRPTVAFLAHVDTAPGFAAAGVKPLVHRRWDGAPIVLPDNPAQVLDPAQNPYLAGKVGHDIVTASGTTLLGADDKAGVAIIMTLAAMLLPAKGPPTARCASALRPTRKSAAAFATCRWRRWAPTSPTPSTAATSVNVSSRLSRPTRPSLRLKAWPFIRDAPRT